MKKLASRSTGSREKVDTWSLLQSPSPCFLFPELLSLCSELLSFFDPYSSEQCICHASQHWVVPPSTSEAHMYSYKACASYVLMESPRMGISQA